MLYSRILLRFEFYFNTFAVLELEPDQTFCICNGAFYRITPDFRDEGGGFRTWFDSTDESAETLAVGNSIQLLVLQIRDEFLLLFDSFGVCLFLRKRGLLLFAVILLMQRRGRIHKNGQQGLYPAGFFILRHIFLVEANWSRTPDLGAAI